MMTKEQIIDMLKTKDHFILAIDGMCGSGKSTLADELAQLFHAHVFHMDDFYLPMNMRTSKRLSEPGGNVHYERFLDTVLHPLILRETVFYQPFDCSIMDLSSVIKNVSYCPFNIIEGSYALRPELIEYYTDIIVLKISKEEQKKRIIKRNKDNYNDFFEKWIPLVNVYFEYYDIYEKYSVISMDS